VDFIKRHISIQSLLAAFVLVIAFLAARVFDLPQDDLQVVFFPLLLPVIWYLPVNREFRIPGLLLILSLVLWLAAYSGIHKISQAELDRPNTFIARLDKDATSLSARALYQRFNQIARTYHLPPMRILHLSFSEDKEVYNWLQNRKHAIFLIRGQQDWLRVVFNPGAKHLFDKHPAANFKGLSGNQQSEIQSFDLNSGLDVYPVKILGASSPLLIVFAPEAVSIPNEPSELSLHLLAWLSRALKTRDFQNQSSWAEQLADRYLAATEASKIDGLWKSATPVGLSYYLLGTFQLLEMLESDIISDTICESSINSFFNAASRANPKNDPELSAAIFNNAAVTLFACAKDPQELKKARSWLNTAISSAAKSNSRGARAALYNRAVLN
jgi:hypothetical protein